MNYATAFESNGKFEQNYQVIVLRFISRKINVETFINEFIARWRLDRGVDISDKRFRRMINRLFTSCDCYDAVPNRAFYEITEVELRNEVELLSHIWWNLSSLDGSVKVKSQLV